MSSAATGDCSQTDDPEHLGHHRILAGAMSVGDLVVFVSYLRVFARPLQRVSRLTERMLRASAAGERVLRILEVEPQIQDRPDAVAAPKLRGEIHWDNVYYRTDIGHRAISREKQS